MAEIMEPNNYPARDQLIATLEAEVQNLTQKASIAVDRLADYEEEIRNLKSSSLTRTDSPVEGTQPPPLSRQSTLPPPLSRQNSTTTSRFSSFLQRSVSHGNKPLPSTPISALGELQAALAKETQLRIAAERKIAEVEGELEDLSATLFEQANEMVATERRARAKLEERVIFLQDRDRERNKRLERIEGALERLDRVRKLLDPKL